MEDYSTFTAKQLNNVNKPLLIEYITSLSSKDNMLKEISKKLDVLNDKFSVQEVVVNKVLEENKKLKSRNNDLERRLADVEYDINKTESYIRRNNIEIQGIPNDISNDSLEQTIISVAQKVGVDIEPSNIEACHRLKRKTQGSKPVIVRFTNRRICEKLHRVKKNLKDTNFKDVQGLNENTKVFFNENLCPYYQKLFSICYKLKKSGYIDSVWSYHGEVYYKIKENDHSFSVTDECELVESFSDFFQ